MRTSLEDNIAYGIALFLIAFFERIPPKWGLRIADALGRLVFYFSKKRRIAYINLKRALGEELSAKDRWRIIREHYGSIGQFVAEVMFFKKLTKEDIDQRIHFHGMERLQELVKMDRGGVLLTAHYGNWEFFQVISAISGNPFSGILGNPLNVLARDQKHPKLNELLCKLRESHGTVAVSRGVGIRYLIKALRGKKIIGLLGDQSAGKDKGIILPFFGRKTTVPTGAFELALRTQVPILPCFMARRPNGLEHDIYMEPILETEGEDSKRIESQAKRYLEILEDYIRRSPSQWLWENKRWKHSWTRKIVILSDGKKGHEKQSEVVSELFKQFKEYHGRAGLDFEIKKIEVVYKSLWTQKLFFGFALLFKPWIQGRLHWLKWFFKDKTFQAIKEVSADFIIATGASLTPLQNCLARETGAKKIVIMKPPFPYNRTHYDLAIIPAHDGGKVPKRTHRSFIMPSGYQTKDLGEEARKLKESLEDPSRVKIAFFLGGAAHRYDFTVSDIEKLVSMLKRFSKDAGDYVLTTSRRTSSHIERFLKFNLPHNSACQHLVIANEDERPYVVGGMMGLADILIVTEDSLAMISEAVGTGKKVIVLSFSRKGLPSKHHRFHQVLAGRGLAVLSRLEDLEDVIRSISHQKSRPVIQKEKESLSEKIKSLL